MADETTTTPAAPAAPSLPPSVATGNADMDARIAAASDLFMVEEDAPAAPVEEPQDALEEPQAGDAEADGEKAVEAAPKAKGKGKPEQREKPRNMMRDLAAEWATARRAQAANQKRAQELEERAAMLEQRAKEADEIALYMQGHPVRAVERLAQKAGISPSEYLQRLQMAYINGEAEQPQTRATDAVAQELAQLRAELQAEKRARAEQEQRAQYEAQFVQIHKQETETLTNLAATYADEFPALATLPPQALAKQVSDAVAWHLSNGVEVGRFEVLQAANNVVAQTLAEYGLDGTIGARAASAPAARADKRTANQATTRPRNGSGRYIPSNVAAAETGGPRRPLTVEERLKAAEKVLFSSE